MAAAVAGFLGGIVVWGSKRSTSKEAAKELTAAEADRAALLRDVERNIAAVMGGTETDPRSR
jgi:hypothetical protein